MLFKISSESNTKRNVYFLEKYEKLKNFLMF